MIRYLIWLLTRIVFVFAVVPAIFGGAFYGLVKLGFSPRAVEVWGLAIIAGTLVLMALKPVEFLYEKIAGPSTPPEMPGWAKAVLTTGGAGLGLSMGGAVAFGLVAFTTVGSWWKIADGSMHLGNVEVQRDAAADDDLFRLDFHPAHGDRKGGMKDAEVKGEVIAFEIHRVRFSGNAGKLVEALGMGDVVLPGAVLVKVDETLEQFGKATSLVPEPSYLTRKILGALESLPGVEVDRLRSEFRKLGNGLSIGIQLSGDKLTLTATQEIKDPPPEPTPEPTRPATPTAEPTPDLPDLPDPTTEPTAPPTQVPTTGPASSAEIALLYPEDPFEGL